MNNKNTAPPPTYVGISVIRICIMCKYVSISIWQMLIERSTYINKYINTKIHICIYRVWSTLAQGYWIERVVNIKYFITGKY